MDGRRVQSGRGTLKTAICKTSDGVKGNEYHTVLGEPDDGDKVRHAKGGPSMK